MKSSGHDDLLSMECQRQEIQDGRRSLEEEKRQIDEMRYDIQTRETQFADTPLQFDNRYCDILPLLPRLKTQRRRSQISSINANS
jgi:hypothetical protein